jgi:hypothetical protein
MPKTSFTAQRDGFHFGNYFVNVIANLPGIGQISTYGRCGGMCYLALDHYFARAAMPKVRAEDFGQLSSVPPDGHPLADYLYQRQLDSFMTLSAVKFVSWSLGSDQSSWFSKGVSRRTKEDEFAKLKESILRGVPVTIGLITARDLAHLGSNHQVIAYGYEETPDAQTLHIYDVNYADREMTLTSARDALGWRQDDDALKLHLEWRGWFVQDYAPKRPPTNLDPPHFATRVVRPRDLAPAKTKLRRKARPATLQVTLQRITFVNDEDDAASDNVAIEFNIGGQAWRWPSTGTKAVEDGKRYRLNKTFEVAIAGDETLHISARPSLSEAHWSALHNGLLESEDAPLDEALAGMVHDSYTAKDKWGVGEHTSRSSGAGGAYTVVYTVSMARPRE